jgi:hypothetical protein
VLPHKKPPGGRLTRQQKEANRLRSHGRVLVDNFFGSWKMLFELIHSVFRGQIEQLTPAAGLTIELTNYYLVHHPLRAGEQEPPPDRDDEQDDVSLAMIIHRLDESSDSE